MTRRRNPGTKARATSTTPIATAESNHHSDIATDLALIGADGDLWVHLFNGRFRLAVKCDVCGRWLTAGKSKANGRGPSCAARAVSQ